MKKIKLMLVFLLLFTSVVFGQYSARLIYFENDTIVVNPTDYPLKFNNAYDIIALLAMDSTWAVITVDTLLAKSPNGNDSLLIYLTNSSSIFKSSLPIYIGESGSGGLPGYSKKKLVTVPAIVSETTNLNVRVNVTYDSDMETDFKDIQFTELDGTLIDQFRESYVSATSSIWWIEIPTCPAAGWTGYMYYDNSGASLSSDGDATFVLFDDFFGTDGDSPNVAKWRTTAAGGGSYSDIQDSTLRVHMETGIEIFVDSQDSLDEGFGIRARLKQDDTSKYPSRYVGFGDGSIYNHQIYYRYYEVGTASWGAYGGATKAAGDMALNTWEIYEIRREKSDTCRYWQDTSEDSLQNQAAANFTDSVRVIFGMKQTTWSPTMNLYVDWVFAIRLPGVSVGGSGDEFEAATLGAEIGSYGEVYLGNTTVLGNLVATSYETSVSGTEVTYLDGVSSSIQDQMDTKATTTYVNEIAANLRWKKEVKVATTANVTLSGEQTIDDSLTAESRILVKSQTDSTQNGVYVTAAGAWSRAVDLNEGFEINASVTRVLEGTVNANKSFVNTNIDSVDIGVTKITYAIFDGGLYSAGDGIAFTGGVISTDNKQAHVDTVGSSGNNLEIEADTVMVDIMQGATGAVKIKGSIDPTDSSSHDLGREDFPWKELWVKGLTTDGDTVRIFLPLKVTSDITASTIDATFDTVSASAFVGASDFVIGASGENVTVNVDSIKGDLVLGADWDNTDNPWADNEVANDITASNYEPLIGTLLTLDTLRIADNSNADTSLFHDDGDTLHIDSENYVSFNNRVYMREHLMLKESMHSGVDDVIVGAVRCYGGTGFVGGTIQLYSGATWDTETDFWRIYPNEDYLLFRDDYHAALKLKPDSLIVTGDVVATNILYKEDSTGTGADSYSTRTALVDTASNHWTELNVRCLESILGTSLGTGLTLDGTVLKASTGLQSLSGLTLTAGDMAIATGANAWNVLDAGATTKILVGGGAGNPVWTEATGTGAPVRAGSPTFTTKIITPEVGIGTAAPFHGLSIYTATPEILITDTDINKNTTSEGEAEDSAGVHIFTQVDGDGQIKITAKDGDVLYVLHNSVYGAVSSNNDLWLIADGNQNIIWDGAALYPDNDNVENLGTTAKRFNQEYFSGSGLYVSDEITIAGTDSCIVLAINGAQPEIQLKAGDGDASEITVNNSDQMVFQNASGGYLYDDDITLTSVADNAIITSETNSASGNVDAAINIDAEAGDAMIFFRDNGSIRWIMGNYHTDDSFYISESSALETTPRLVVENTTGHVGIGDTTPDEKLDVEGDIITGETTNGDANTVLNYMTTKVWCDSTLNVDADLGALLPAGYYISSIMWKETTGNGLTNFDIGFSAGGADIIANVAVGANEETGVVPVKTVADFDAADNIFIDADGDWSTSNLILWIKMEKMF